VKQQATKQARIPERRCAGCGERFPKFELVRVVCGEDGRAVIDTRMKAQSRGVYVCKKESCLKKALKSGRLSSSVSAVIDSEAEDAIRTAVLGGIPGGENGK